ncbi:MAG: tetratricopeptide repeat protein, partial [Gammaproteobacteria bacterium]|nr:tetratricopeptide repeat protein [Gammaproteobacteria bacterium]
SFFHAFSADSGNADYAFNLAVSLDHMGQYAAAADYYRKALELSGRRPANFVSVTVERRIKALEQDTGKAP